MTVDTPGRVQGGLPINPRQRVAERTFAWLGRYQRRPADLDRDPLTSESMIRVAMTHPMVQRLAPPG